MKPRSFIYPTITPKHYRFGAVQGTILRPDGDWRGYMPAEEAQNRNGVESSACYIESLQHPIATAEELMWGEQNNNYASRFNALMSGGTEQGGDPLKGAASICKDGLVPEGLMPFSDAITSWEDFHSWKGANRGQVIAQGQRYLMTRKPTYEIVVEKHYDVKTKYNILRAALPYAPASVSVLAWILQNGEYIKPQGANDTHLVELVHIDNEFRSYIWDTYEPYLKRLSPFYDFDFGLTWKVRKLTESEQLGQLTYLLNLMFAHLRSLTV